MPKTTRLVGPPGTGKTTKLTLWARNLGAKYGPANVMICSLTRTAAKEIAGRETGIPDTNVGTLHAHAYRAMQAEGRSMSVFGSTKKHVEEFNAMAPEKFEMSLPSTSTEEGSKAKVRGDKIKERVDLRLARRELTKIVENDEDTEFMSLFNSFKNANGLVDFTDMLVYALENIDCPYQYLIADEAQDYSALEWALIRKWTDQCEGAVVAGDSDQCLYEWRGASVEDFVSFGDKRIVLDQSYRVAMQPWLQAEHIVKRIHTREDREYKPTDQHGFAHFIDRKYLFDHALGDSGSVMLLAPCGAMTLEWIKHLKERGIPFHNPYRKEGDYAAAWNPLKTGTNGAVTARDRVEAFLNPPWSKDQLKAWLLPMQRLPRGVKKWLSDPDRDMGLEDLGYILGEDGLGSALAGDLDWWSSNLLSSKRAPLVYPIKVAQRGGVEALTDTPQIILGTIHSVKGGEADNVYVLPDLGKPWRQAWMYGQRDPILRMMFVAATRARNNLVMIKPYMVGATRTFQWNG